VCSVNIHLYACIACPHPHTPTHTPAHTHTYMGKRARKGACTYTHEYTRTHTSTCDAPKYAQQMRKTKRVKAHANKDAASVRPLALMELMQLATLLSPKTARTINGLCPSSPCSRTHVSMHSVLVGPPCSVCVRLSPCVCACVRLSLPVCRVRPVALQVTGFPPALLRGVGLFVKVLACECYSRLSLLA